MRFQSTRGGDSLLFREAIVRGYPLGGGFFAPAASGGSPADIRSAVYAPDAGFADIITLAASELLPELLDPRLVADLAFAAFGREPGLVRSGDGILVLDVASGASGSATDYSAAFTAGLLGRLGLPAGAFVLAAASARDAAALGSAFASSGCGLPLVLLCAEGEGPGMPVPASPSSHPSPVILIEVKGGLEAASALERRLAGSSPSGRQVVAGGAASPARLLGRSLLLVGLFCLARKGLSGDLVVAAPPADLLGLVTGLWAWDWGLPVSAFLLPSLEAGDQGASVAIEGTDPDLAAGKELLGCFDKDHPLGSLVISMPLEAGRPTAASVEGLPLDLGSGLALEAARAALSAGIAGHGKILVPRFARPWGPDGAGETAGNPAPSLIEASPEALEAVLARLLPRP